VLRRGKKEEKTKDGSRQGPTREVGGKIVIPLGAHRNGSQINLGEKIAGTALVPKPSLIAARLRRGSKLCLSPRIAEEGSQGGEPILTVEKAREKGQTGPSKKLNNPKRGEYGGRRGERWKITRFCSTINKKKGRGKIKIRERESQQGEPHRIRRESIGKQGMKNTTWLSRRESAPKGCPSSPKK